MAVTCRRHALAALLGLVALAPADAQRATDPPLTLVRSWTLAEGDLASPQLPGSAHRLRLDMAVMRGSRWEASAILVAAREAGALLAQCGVALVRVQLHEFDGPPRYRMLWTPDAREFAQRSGLRKPAIFFVDDTLQRPAFDAEAVGRANARARPEMADTVWITAGIRDLPVALAHELVHVLTESGDHSGAPDNLMRAETAVGNRDLDAGQCQRIVAQGAAKGLLETAAATDGSR